MDLLDLPDDARVSLTVRQLKEMLRIRGAGVADIDRRAALLPPVAFNIALTIAQEI